MSERERRISLSREAASPVASQLPRPMERPCRPSDAVPKVPQAPRLRGFGGLMVPSRPKRAPMARVNIAALSRLYLGGPVRFFTLKRRFDPWKLNSESSLT